MSIPVLKLVAKADSDLIVAKYRTRQIAELANLSSLEMTRLVTAVSESLRNAITHAGEARIEFNVFEEGRKQFVEVIVSDDGPGFSEGSLVRQGEKVSGLAVCKKLLDSFEIESSSGSGCRLRLLKMTGKTARRIDESIVQDWIQELKRNSPFSVVEDLEQQNKQLIDTLTELEKIRNKLEERTEQLNQANKYKGEFLANMSHEIRTPMNAVIGMSNILDRTELNVEQKKYLRLIKEAGSSLLDIINDILDFSKIEAGKLSIETVEFELFDVVETCVELLSANAQSKGLSLLCWMDPALPRQVASDSVRLRQILVNLINNAIKFTSSGGEVIVRVKLMESQESEARIRCEVMDSGIGLSQEQMDKLFKPFVQADGSTTRKFGGTGLGLSICKQLVDLMKGRIGVDSVLGSGSTFWFELPVIIAESEEVEPPKLPYKRALIVDDHLALREMASFLLNAWNLENEAVESGREALDIIKKNDYDLFILDYVMPEMNGIELAKIIRTIDSCKDSQIVLLTALQDGSLGEQAIAAGCNGFLTKPLRQELFFECLSALKDPVKKELKTSRSMKAKHENQVQLRETVTAIVASSQAAGADGARVLLVEDNPTNQIVAGIELRNLNLEVSVASNGEEALKCLETSSFSLVFMDCQMPVMDGFECTKRIRTNESKTGKHIPIIAMTANAMEGDRERCIAAGMDDYISKPFEPEQLQALIGKYLALGVPAESANGESALSNQPAAEAAPSLSALDYEKFRSKFNEKQAKQLIMVYLMDTEKKVADLAIQVEASNCDAVAKLAHGIKGASSMIFAEALTNASRELEAAGKANELSRLRELSSILNAEFERFKEFAAGKF